MKNLKIAIIGFSILGLVACNSGSDGGQPAPGPGPSPEPVVLESLPYTYTTDYATGELTNNLPTVDLLPFGASASVTFTFTNPYKESSIWFAAYRDNELVFKAFGEFYSPNETQPFSSRTEFEYYSNPASTADDCRQFTPEKPLPPGGRCKFTQNITGISNFYNSESVDMLQQVTYAITDPSASGIGYVSKTFIVNAYAKTGIWYRNLPNYKSMILDSFHVLNESGTDYMYQTRRAANNPIGKLKITFNNDGVPIIDYNNVEACTLDGCVNGIIPTDGYNIILPPVPYYNPNGNYIGPRAYDQYRHINTALNTLDNTYIDRDCFDAVYCPKTVFSQVFAVQPDGTIVGKNRNGTFGCTNRDGSNFRTLNVPSNINIESYYSSMSTSPDTITYGQTNWIFAQRYYESGVRGTMSNGEQVYVKVNANTSGLCQLESQGAFLEATVIYGFNFAAPVRNQLQITPNGIYGFGNSSGLGFYKYLPREYMRN